MTGGGDGVYNPSLRAQRSNDGVQSQAIGGVVLAGP